ncbi:Putative restriction endonuclease domain-containing protein [Tumidithrix helvetica PCC 7403]|uniref:Uma2 family endonuclease n=1 Tax=Tumidithrix helvetica TaxID=3457545 RepID=UPI003CB2B599
MIAELKTKITFEQYCNYAEHPEHRYELVDGELVLVNPPTFRHLLIAKAIEQILSAEILRIKASWVCIREAGVRTGINRSRLTDVMILTAEQVKELIDTSAICESAAVMVVEVVSLDSIKRDYRYKRAEYAALGVPEYWIVDPLQHKVSVLLLEDGLYEESEFEGEQNIISQTFPDLGVTAAQLLAVQLADT